MYIKKKSVILYSCHCNVHTLMLDIFFLNCHGQSAVDWLYCVSQCTPCGQSIFLYVIVPCQPMVQYLYQSVMDQPVVLRNPINEIKA